jgi:uncharacterized membrane protein YgdD (TMEM256/DUF423 family)
MKKYILSAGLAGLTGVILGAFGAHAMKEALASQGSTSTWQTAVFYQVSHAIAVLALSLQMQNPSTADRKWLSRACACWLLGILFFSGSLYLLALGGPKWLGPVTPLGGVFLLAGWGGVILHALKSPQPTSA